MPLASLPGPPSAQWHVGPIPVHGYALCLVLGVLTAFWVAERRYRALGGRSWLMADLAVVAAPAALVGARLFRVVTDAQLFFGHGRDWVDVLRVWDGGVGLPGAAAGGLVAALIWGRRTGTGIGPVLSAATPGLAFGQAVAVLGNWFSQSLYGAPSTWLWAVPIAPRYRIPGYQDFGTFQPLFLYEAVWDVLVGVLVIRLIARYRLTGERALAACAGLYAIGRFVIVSLLLRGPRQSSVLTEQLAAAVIVTGAVAYLYLTRDRHSPQPLKEPARLGPAPAGLRPPTTSPELDHPKTDEADAKLVPDLGKTPD